MDEGIKCTLSKFVDDTELSGTVDLLQSRKGLQNIWVGWTESNHVPLNKGKRQVLYLGHSNPVQLGEARLGEELLESCPTEKKINESAV